MMISSLDNQRVSDRWKFYVLLDEDGFVSEIKHLPKRNGDDQSMAVVRLEDLLAKMSEHAADPRMDMRAVLAGMLGTALILGSLWCVGWGVVKAINLLGG
jgi:hypothetical protein